MRRYATAMIATFAFGALDILGATIYVDVDATGAEDGTSWVDAYVSLQDGLASARAGDQIWVAEGEYKPDRGGGQVVGDRAATFQLVNGVEVYGGFTGAESTLQERDFRLHETLLSGDIGVLGDQADNSHHVVTSIDTGTATILDGFTIEGGNTTGGPVETDDGAGLLTSGSGTSPWLRNLSFRNNLSSGAGTLAVMGGAEPLVEDCIFEGNTAGSGGGVFNSNSSPTYVGCEFYGNKTQAINGAAGSAMFSNNSQVSCYGCVFAGNGHEPGPPHGLSVVRSIGNSELLVVNGVISGNATYSEGAVYVMDGSAILVNTTVANNAMMAGTGGGGVFAAIGSTVDLDNVILWGNSDSSGAMLEDDQVRISPGSAVDVRYSLVQGWTGLLAPEGIGNFSADPLFLDPDGVDEVLGTSDDDLRLGVGSPAIDAGETSILPPDLADLDGDGDTSEALPWDTDGLTRVVGTAVDVGAYEVRHSLSIDCGGLDACPQGTFVYLVNASNASGGTLRVVVRILPGPGIPASPQLFTSFLDDGASLVRSEEIRTPGSVPTVCPTTVVIEAELQTSDGQPVASETCSIEFIELTD